MSVSLQVSPPEGSAQERDALRRLSWLFLTLGIVSIVIGALAIGVPQIATFKTIVFIGVLLLIAGIVELIHAVAVRNLRGFAMHLLGAALYMILGIFVLEDPDRTAGVLTLLLAAAFWVGGVFRILFSIIGQFPAWPWVLLNGIIDLFLGSLIWRGWPGTSDWVIGLFVGIELLFHGWTWVILGLTVRSASAAPSA
jgi:uncharacterized membrane protein HdeD (DUF308 family)